MLKNFLFLFVLISGYSSGAQCVNSQPSNCDNYIKEVKIIGSLNSLQTDCSGWSTNNYIFSDTLTIDYYYYIEVFTNRNIQVGAWIDYNSNYLFEANEKLTLVSNTNLADSLIPAIFRIRIASGSSLNMLVRCYSDTATHDDGCFQYHNGESEIYKMRFRQNYPVSQLKYISPGISFNSNIWDKLFAVANLYNSIALTSWYYSDDSILWQAIPANLITLNSITLNRGSQKKYYKFVCYTSTDTIRSPVYKVDINTTNCLCKNASMFSENIAVKNFSIENNIVYNNNSFRNSYVRIGNYNLQNFKKGNTYNFKCEVISNQGYVRNSYLYLLIDKNNDKQFTDDELVSTSVMDSMNVNGANYNLYFKVDEGIITGSVDMELLISEYPVSSFCNAFKSGQTILFSLNVIDQDTVCQNLKAGRIAIEDESVYMLERFQLKLVDYNLVKNGKLTWFKSVDGFNFIPLTNKNGTGLLDSISSPAYYKVKMSCGNDSQETAIYHIAPGIKYCLPQSILRSYIGFTFINLSNLIYGKIEHTVDNAPLFYYSRKLKDTAIVFKNNSYMLYAKVGYPKSISGYTMVACYIDKNKDGMFDSSELLFKKYPNSVSPLQLTIDSTFSSGYHTMRLIAFLSGDTLVYPCMRTNMVQSVDFILYVQGTADNSKRINSKYKLYSNDEELCKGQYPRVSIQGVKPIADQHFYWEFSTNNKFFYSSEKYSIEPFLIFRFDTNIYVRCIIKNSTNYDTTETIYFKRRYFFDCYSMASAKLYDNEDYIQFDSVNINGESLINRGRLFSNGYVDLTKDIIWNLQANQPIPLKISRRYYMVESFIARIFIDKNHDGIFDSTEQIKEISHYKEDLNPIVLDSFSLGNNILPGVTKLRIMFQALDLRPFTAYGLTKRGIVFDVKVDVSTGQSCSIYTPVIYTQHTTQCSTNPFTIRILNNNYMNNRYVWYNSNDSITWLPVNNGNSELITYITAPAYYKVSAICGADTQTSNVIKVELNSIDKCGPSYINRIFNYKLSDADLKYIKVGNSDLGQFTQVYNAYKLDNIYMLWGKYDFNYYRNIPHVLWCNKSTSTTLISSYVPPNHNSSKDSMFIAVLIDSNMNNNFEINELLGIKKINFPAGSGALSSTLLFNSSGMKSNQNMIIRFITSRDSTSLLSIKKPYTNNTVYDFTIVFFDTDYYVDKLRKVDTREGSGGFASVSLERTSRNGISKYYFDMKNSGTNEWGSIDSSDVPTFILPFAENNRSYRIHYNLNGTDHFSDVFKNKVDIFSEYQDRNIGSMYNTDFSMHLNDYGVSYPEEFSKEIPALPNQVILRKGTDNYYQDNYNGWPSMFPYVYSNDSSLDIYDNPAPQPIPFIQDLVAKKFRIPDFIKSGSYNYALNKSDYKEDEIANFFWKKTYDVLILDALPCGDSINPIIQLDKDRYCKNENFDASLKNYQYCDKATYEWFYSFNKVSWFPYSNSNTPFCKRSSDTSIYLKCKISYNNRVKEVVSESLIKFEIFGPECVCKSYASEKYSIYGAPNVSRTDIAGVHIYDTAFKLLFINRFLSGQYGDDGYNYRDFRFMSPIKLPKKDFNLDITYYTQGSSGYFKIYSYIDFNSNYSFEPNESFPFLWGFYGQTSIDMSGEYKLIPIDSNIASGKRMLRINIKQYGPGLPLGCGLFPTGETQDYWLDFRNNVDLQLTLDSRLQKPVQLCSGNKVKPLMVNILNYGIDTLFLTNDSVKITGVYYRNNTPLITIDTFITNLLWKSDSNILLDLNRSVSFNALTHDSIALKLTYPTDKDATNNFIRYAIGIDSSFVVDLGPDTIKCKYDIVSLKSNVSGGNYKYLWNTGQTTPEIFVLDEGNYVLLVTNEEGCQSIDTINVRNSFMPGKIIPSDTFICNARSITISLPYFTDIRYKWENGDTSGTRKFTVNGDYKLRVMNSDGCFEYYPMHLTLDSMLDAIPQKVVTQCEGTYKVFINNFNSDYKYLWSNGSSLPNPVFNETGRYYLIITNPAGCIKMDSLDLTIIKMPIPIFKDTTVTSGDTVFLTAASSKSYFWNTGDTTQTIKITKSGKYSVKLSNAANCFITDSTYVRIIKSYTIKFGGVKYFCVNGNVKIDYLPSNLNYLWNDGYKNSVYYITQPGLYWFTATDSAGNLYKSDTLTVIKQNDPNCDLTATKVGTLNYHMAPMDTTNDSYSWLISGNTYTGMTVDIIFPSYATYNISLTCIKNGCTNTCNKLINIIAGINATKGNDFMVFPNPTENKINFKGTIESFKNIKVVDSKGVLLFNEDNFSLSAVIDLSNYASGIFLVIVNNETSFKVIKK